MRLENKVAIITGGARGVGNAIAEAMAAEGARIVVMDPGGSKDGKGSEAAPAEEAAAKIRAAGGQAIAVVESVADHAACKRAVEAAVAAFGTVDILVNNAGVLRAKMLWNLSEEDWDTVVAVHLKGQYNMIHHVSPILRAKKWGRIINMGSEAWRGTVGQANYGAAKGGVFSLTRAAAREMGRYGITVNTMCPAAATRLTLDDAVKAGFKKRLDAGLITQARYDQVVNMGGPEHVAPFAVYLASDAAENINGQAFRVEQGMVAIYNDPEFRATLSSDGRVFGVDDFDRLVPKTLLGGYSNPAPRQADDAA